MFPPLQIEGNNGHHPNKSRVVIHRDYSQGLGVRFSTEFPAELEGRIEQDAFYDLINKINKYFGSAEKVSFYSVVDSVLGCLTAYLIFLCFDSHYDRCVKKVSRFIDKQNKNIWIPRGMTIVDPGDKGMRVIEIMLEEETGPIFTGGSISKDSGVEEGSPLFQGIQSEVKSESSQEDDTDKQFGDDNLFVLGELLREIDNVMSDDLHEDSLLLPKETVLTMDMMDQEKREDTPVMVDEVFLEDNSVKASQHEPLLGKEYSSPKKTYHETALD